MTVGHASRSPAGLLLHTALQGPLAGSALATHGKFEVDRVREEAARRQRGRAGSEQPFLRALGGAGRPGAGAALASPGRLWLPHAAFPLPAREPSGERGGRQRATAGFQAACVPRLASVRAARGRHPRNLRASLHPPVIALKLPRTQAAR
jgi:hypothetical protein